MGDTVRYVPRQNSALCSKVDDALCCVVSCAAATAAAEAYPGFKCNLKPPPAFCLVQSTLHKSAG